MGYVPFLAIQYLYHEINPEKQKKTSWSVVVAAAAASGNDGGSGND